MSFSGVATLRPPEIARGVYLFGYIAAMRDCDDYGDTRRMRGGGEPPRRRGTRGLTSDAHEPGRCYILTVP